MESTIYMEGTRGLLLAALEKAKIELAVVVFLIDDERFLKLIEKKAEEGVSVRVIGVLEQTDTERTASAIESLEEKGKGKNKIRC